MARKNSAFHTDCYCHERIATVTKKLRQHRAPISVSRLLRLWVTSDSPILQVRFSNSIETSLSANWRSPLLGSWNFDSSSVVCEDSRVSACGLANDNSPRADRLIGRQCSSCPPLPSLSAICHSDCVQVGSLTYPSHSNFPRIQSLFLGFVGLPFGAPYLP